VGRGKKEKRDKKKAVERKREGCSVSEIFG